jgi:FdhD protein
MIRPSAPNAVATTTNVNAVPSSNDRDQSEAEVRPAMVLRKSSVNVGLRRIGTSSSNPQTTDRVIGEEPMEIRLEGDVGETITVGITMRTPGHDFELAVGFLRSEGLLQPGDVKKVAYCVKPIGVEQQYNIVTVAVRGAVPDGANRRLQLMSASCGICGTASLDAVALEIPVANKDTMTIDEATLIDLPDRLRAEQKLFALTGGVHGIALCTTVGEVLVTREDVGRHNAVDKTIGWATLQEKDLGAVVLVVSGRTSFEIVQKAAMSGIRMIVGVSAPSSLAVDAADRFGITLAGFVRNGGANIYTHDHRVL